MSALLDQVLAAHGGIERWRSVRVIRAHLDMTGPTWSALGQEKAFVDVDVEVHLPEQRTVFTGFTGAGLRGIYTPGHVLLTDEHGTVLNDRHAPRDSFPVRRPDIQWDALQALYLGGYGLWNYLTAPYLLTLPGVRAEELDDRRLRVTFPPEIDTHSTEQTFYFDENGVQRRVDYQPSLLGKGMAAHHTENHRSVSGLVFPTHRYVLPIVDGRPSADPTITLDLADISVEFAAGVR